MGKSVAATYGLYIRGVSGSHYTPITWHTRSGPNRVGNGKPTVANLDKWVKSFEQSMVSGPNKHLAMDQTVYAEIRHYPSNTVVAKWARKEQRPHQPLFEALTPIPAKFCT